MFSIQQLLYLFTHRINVFLNNTTLLSAKKQKTSNTSDRLIRLSRKKILIKEQREGIRWLDKHLNLDLIDLLMVHARGGVVPSHQIRAGAPGRLAD